MLIESDRLFDASVFYREALQKEYSVVFEGPFFTQNRSSRGGRALRLGGGPRIDADDFGLIGFATVDADLEDLPLDTRGAFRCW
jgi:hypothetical protein